MLVQIVDENDRPIGGATKQEIWEKGLKHRIVGVFILDEKGRILSQKRAVTKHPYPNCWDLAVGGHVDEGEDYEVAAHRELIEETGITDPLVLKKVDYFPSNKIVDGKILNRFNMRYQTTIDSKTPIHFDPGEAELIKWFTPNEARDLLKDSSSKLTNTFRRALEKYFE